MHADRAAEAIMTRRPSRAASGPPMTGPSSRLSSVPASFDASSR